jgi:hypothetical protein
VNDVAALVSWDFNAFSCTANDMFGHLTTMFKQLNVLEVGGMCERRSTLSLRAS